MLLALGDGESGAGGGECMMGSVCSSVSACSDVSIGEGGGGATRDALLCLLDGVLCFFVLCLRSSS